MIVYGGVPLYTLILKECRKKNRLPSQVSLNGLIFLNLCLVLLQTDMAPLTNRDTEPSASNHQAPRESGLHRGLDTDAEVALMEGRERGGPGETGERHVLKPKDSICEIHMQNNPSECLLCAGTGLTEGV